MFKQELVNRTNLWVCRYWVAVVALLVTGMYSLPAQGDLECVTLTFEGIPNNQDLIQPIQGITFPAIADTGCHGWVAIILGTNTVAVPVTAATPSCNPPNITDFDVFFDEPVQSVSFLYGSVSAVTVTTYGVDSAGDPIIGEPVIFANTGSASSLTGSVSVEADSLSTGITRIVVNAERGNTFIDDFTTCRVINDPITLIENLINSVFLLNLNQGIENSLDAKLEAVARALEDANQNNNVSACNKLQAFINEVTAQSGEKISSSDAENLINQAQLILNLFGDG